MTIEDTRDRTICTACGHETDRERRCSGCGVANPEAWEITCGECDGAGSVRVPLDLAVDYFGRWRTAECPRCLGNKTVDAPFLAEAEAFAAERCLKEPLPPLEGPCTSCGKPDPSGQWGLGVPMCSECYTMWFATCVVFDTNTPNMADVPGYEPHYKALSPLAIAAEARRK